MTRAASVRGGDGLVESSAIHIHIKKNAIISCF